MHTQSFGRALKGALREDPDVIVIGELRDVETVEIALEAAETGHLVVATMSTRSGAKTIDRLIDMFPPDKQGPVRHTLAGALKIIVSQRLIPSADGKAMCAAAEVISGNVQLWNLIRDNKLIQLPSLLQRGRSMGMLRFDESLKALVQEGKVSEEVAMRYAEDHGSFARCWLDDPEPRLRRLRRRHQRLAPRRRSPTSRPRVVWLLWVDFSADESESVLPPAIDALFDQMLTAGASDLHISPGYPVMLRLRGDLVPLNQQVLSATDAERLLYEILDEKNRASFDAERDLDFAYAFGTRARFRANYLGKTTGIGAVFRTIPSKILTLEQLALPEAIRGLAERRIGLILVTGPTGSGKSTTLAAILDYINKTRAGHILTVEDPVEFVHTAQRCQITHREVGRDVPSFADAIRSAGRENADVVLVGELRGAETMGLALQMAGSGVLVFATVHTNSAAATIDRYVNAFPADRQPAVRGMLAETLTGVISQQLLKKGDGSGRVAAHEIMICNRALASAIRESRTSLIPSILQSGQSEGMQTMDRVLQKLVEQGTITAFDAIEKALDKESFKKVPAVTKALEEQQQAGMF